MKKYFCKIFLLFIILFFCGELPAQWSLKSNTEDGKYSLATNSGNYFGISAGNVLGEAVLMLTSSDTSTWRLVSNTENGLYSIAENKISFMGIDSGKVRTKAVYILNPSTLTTLGLDTTRLAYLSKANSFIGRKQTFDTVNVTVKYLLNGSDINSSGVLTNVAYLNQTNVFSANTKVSGHLAINTAGVNPIPFVSVGMTSGDSNIAGLNIVSTTFNTVRNSQSQATDTCSITLGLTQWSNSPYLSMISKSGAIQFSVDTVGKVYGTSFNIGTVGGTLFTVSNNLVVQSGTSRDLLFSTGTAGTIWTFQSALGNIIFAPLAVTGSSTTPAFDISQTWNTSGAPTGFKMNITNTSSSASSLLMDLQVGGSTAFNVNTAGNAFISGSLKLGQILSQSSIGGASIMNLTQRILNLNFYNTSETSGTVNTIMASPQIIPTSGTAVFNAFNLQSTINQTGGANGITRGLYINPTLTSAADWRAIEVSTGKSVFRDVVINNDTNGVVLKDSNGHYWRITVNTSGVISTADLGTSLNGF